MATSINAEFVIVGDTFNPVVITEKLGIEPQNFWRKGEKVFGRPVERKDTCWIISTGYEESFYISEQLNKILATLRNKEEILRELKIAYTLEYFFQIVVRIEEDMKPAINVDSEFIEFANSIKAELEIDLYIY